MLRCRMTDTGGSSVCDKCVFHQPSFFVRIPGLCASNGVVERSLILWIRPEDALSPSACGERMTRAGSPPSRSNTGFVPRYTKVGQSPPLRIVAIARPFHDKCRPGGRHKHVFLFLPMTLRKRRRLASKVEKCFVFAAGSFSDQCLFQSSNDVLVRFAVAVSGEGFFEFVEGDVRGGQRFGFEQEAVILAVEAEVVVPEEVQRSGVGRGLRPESSIVVSIYPPAVGNGGRGKWQGAAVDNVLQGGAVAVAKGSLMEGHGVLLRAFRDAPRFAILLCAR